DRHAELAGEHLAIAAPKLHDAAADGPASEQADPDWFHFPLLARSHGRGSGGHARHPAGLRGHPARERLTDSADRLAGAMLVLDEREADEAVAVGAEANARRNGDLGLGEQ